MKRFSSIWKYSSSYSDLTANTDTNTDFNFISAASDIIYLGFDRRWQGIYCDLTTNGSYTSLSYYYWTGSTWKLLPLIDAYTFSASKYQRWNVPNDWAKESFTSTWPHSSAPPDEKERYWVKITVSAVTTTAVVNKIRCIPFVEYATSDDVAEIMQIRNNFSSSSKPTDLVVEKYIRRAEDRIDYRSKKSWKFNAVTESTGPILVDYTRYGFFLRHRNFTKVYSIQMWNGGSWDTLTEGRDQDYLINYDLGMCYLTRMFILPAGYGMAGRYMHFGYGEYKDSIKADYVYGRDPEVDPEFYIVNEIASKMAAISVYTSSDFTNLVVSGTDKVSLEGKLRKLEDEVEQRLDELTGVSIS